MTGLLMQFTGCACAVVQQGDNPFRLARHHCRHAQAALRETLVTMSARVVDDACVAVPILGSGLTEDGIVEHPAISTVLLASLEHLQASAMDHRGLMP